VEQSIDRHESSGGDADAEKKTGMGGEETQKLVEVFLVQSGLT
jgi:hypothetical protein